jgi:hypothetical protein
MWAVQSRACAVMDRRRIASITFDRSLLAMSFVWQDFAYSSASAMMACLFTNPADTIKTRMVRFAPCTSIVMCFLWLYCVSNCKARN